MWAQKYRDCFPSKHYNVPEQRVRVGHFLVPPELVEEYKKKLKDQKPTCQWSWK
jgi:hypothetical protein